MLVNDGVVLVTLTSTFNDKTFYELFYERVRIFQWNFLDKMYERTNRRVALKVRPQGRLTMDNRVIPYSISLGLVFLIIGSFKFIAVLRAAKLWMLFATENLI